MTGRGKNINLFLMDGEPDRGRGFKTPPYTLTFVLGTSSNGGD